jgi:hypothetical protein
MWLFEERVIDRYGPEQAGGATLARPSHQLTGAVDRGATTKSSSGSLRTYLVTRLLLVIPMVWCVTLVFFDAGHRRPDRVGVGGQIPTKLQSAGTTRDLIAPS